jgi:hypothetical protein
MRPVVSPTASQRRLRWERFAQCRLPLIPSALAYMLVKPILMPWSRTAQTFNA